MSGIGRTLRLGCAAAVVAALVPGPAAAVPGPGERSVTQLLTELRALYGKAEDATQTYRATAGELKKQRAETARLGAELSRARLALHDSRGAAGQLARQQYQGDGQMSAYVRLLLARDPQRALDQGHVIRRLAAERVETVGRLVSGEKRADALAARSRKALDTQLRLAERQKKARDVAVGKLKEVEELLVGLSAEEIAGLRRAEEAGAGEAAEAGAALEQREALGLGAGPGVLFPQSRPFP